MPVPLKIWIIFFQEGVGGNLAFEKKQGSPKSFYPLHPRQAAGQGFGVSEEGLDFGVA